MDPVVTVRWVVKAPIIIVANDDRIVVIAIVTTDAVARYVMAVIDETDRRAETGLAPT